MTRRPLLILAAALTLPASITHTSSHIAGGTFEAGSPVATVNPARAHGANSGASFLRPQMKGGAVPPWGDGTASRNFARPVLPASPDPAADQPAARAQTSPGAVLTVVESPRSVATLGPGVVKGNPTPVRSVWDRLAFCESRGQWHINTGNGFTGGLQFVTSTWLSNGGGRYAPAAYLATKAQQIEIATVLQSRRGWEPWPACSKALGLR